MTLAVARGNRLIVTGRLRGASGICPIAEERSTA
jgi:hypothetical protein